MLHRYKGKHAVARAIRALSARARISIVTGTLAMLAIGRLVLATGATAENRAHFLDQCQQCSTRLVSWQRVHLSGLVPSRIAPGIQNDSENAVLVYRSAKLSL